jgi:RND family efflux transporter MFP subunit
MPRRRIYFIFAFLGLLALSALAFFLVRSRQLAEEPYRTLTVEPRTITQDITFTGRLAAEESATLGFEITGSVKDILVAVGDRVEAGQLLVALDPQSVELELSKAAADLAAAQYDTYLAWQKTQTDLAAASQEQDQALTQKQQAVRDAKAELDRQKEVYLQTEREVGDSSLTTTALLALRAKESAYHAAQQALDLTASTQAKTNQANQSAATLAQAKYHSTLRAAGNNPGLSSLEASRQLAGLKVSKANIIAPLSGVVTDLLPSVGEIVTAASPVLTLQTLDHLEITADVTETDATRLSPGLPATITFDALSPPTSYSGEVSRLAPAAKVLEGVPTYEVALVFTSPLPDISKPGLSVTVTVHAAQQEGVLGVPRRALIKRGDQTLLRILGRDGFLAEQSVTTGLLGSDGFVEITSGLAAGDEVVLSSSSAD